MFSDDRLDLITSSDGYQVSLIKQGKKGYTFQVFEPGEDAGDILPALTAAEWASAAIRLLVNCPDARDTIGLVTATADGLVVTGKTLPNPRKWTVTFTDVGSDQQGRTLLEWSSSRPLAIYEFGPVFKSIVPRFDEMSQAESDVW
jgi:hypothetical protein